MRESDEQEATLIAIRNRASPRYIIDNNITVAMPNCSYLVTELGRLRSQVRNPHRASLHTKFTHMKYKTVLDQLHRQNACLNTSYALDSVGKNMRYRVNQTMQRTHWM